MTTETKQFTALGNLVLEGAELIFRNFAGREQTYNSEGDRNFCVFLTPEMAAELREQGWNVKTLRARDEGDEPREYIKVNVRFGNSRPPKIVLITSKKRTEIGEEEVPMLDFADVQNWDIVINPWVNPKSETRQVSGYLKTAFVTLHEDVLELKYADLEEDQDPTTSSSTASEED